MTMASPLLFLILVPLVAIAFILIGSNARATALIASATNLVFVLALFAVYKPGEAHYQFVSTVPVIPAMGIAFTLGADGLSLVMLLLAAPAALAPQRNNQATLLLFSLAAGLLFLAVDGVLTALGQTNVLPPLLGAWAGPALFAALAGAALVHLEG